MGWGCSRLEIRRLAWANPSSLTASTSLSSSPISSKLTLWSNIPPASPPPADVTVRPPPLPTPLPGARGQGDKDGPLPPPPPTNPDLPRQKAGAGRLQAAEASAGPTRPRIDEPTDPPAGESILIRGVGGPEKPSTALLLPRTSIVAGLDRARAGAVQQASDSTMAAAMFMEAAWTHELGRCVLCREPTKLDASPPPQTRIPAHEHLTTCLTSCFSKSANVDQSIF
jgi:hypothetical protein